MKRRKYHFGSKRRFAARERLDDEQYGFWYKAQDRIMAVGPVEEMRAEAN